MSWKSKFCFHATYISSFDIIYFSVNMSSKVRYKTPLQFPYCESSESDVYNTCH